MKIMNQKGQSLIEVTVALGILAVVLSAVVTLAAQGIGLMIASRQRTEATALAQKSLEVLKGNSTNVCDGNKTVNAGIALSTLGGIGDIPGQFISSTYEVVDHNFPGISITGYRKATVTVKWKTRLGGDTDLSVSQIFK